MSRFRRVGFTIDTNDRSAEYRLDPESINAVLLNYQRLVKTTVVWPNPWELMYYGEKGILAECLDRASNVATSSKRPQVARLNPGTDLAAVTDLVLKRGYSGYADHVHLPILSR